MRGDRAFIIGSIGVAAVAIIAACVGDDPTSAPGTTGTPEGGPDTGLAQDSGGSGNDGGGADDTGTDSGADAAKRYCETVAKPVAPTEFFCADFDGTDVAEGWTKAVTIDGGAADGGVFTLTNTVAVSLPQSFAAKPPNGTGNGTAPLLSWTSVGAKNFAQAELRVRMNPSNTGIVPTYTGTIKLLEIRTSNGAAALWYTNGANLTSNPASNGYVGYFIKVSTFGGAAQLSDHPLTTPLANTTWTDAKLTFFKNGRVTLTYNGISIFDQTKYASTDTSVTFSVGAALSGAVTEQKVMRYDNVEVTLTRDP